jgi:hypothetical protein
MARAHEHIAKHYRNLPDQERGPHVAKAHVEQHTRVVGGKTVQVSGYETHANAAHAISTNAHAATSHAIGKGHEENIAAADLHKQAAEAHQTAAQHAPEGWQQRGHEQQATLHGHYADSHATEAAKTAPKESTGTKAFRLTQEANKSGQQAHHTAAAEAHKQAAAESTAAGLHDSANSHQAMARQHEGVANKNIAYGDAKSRAHQMSYEADLATTGARGGEQHTAAASAHDRAAEAHEEAHKLNPGGGEHAQRAANHRNDAKFHKSQAGPASPEDHTKAAKAAGREAAMKARGESGYEEAQGKAAMLHEKAGMAHLQAHAEGKGSEHANEASHHFAQSVDHTGESHGAAGKYQHAAKIAGIISEHADAHKLEDNYKSHDQHAAGHLMAIEAHGQAREAAQANASRSRTNGDEEKAASYQGKADAHHAKVNHHRAEMAKGHDEINLRAKRAESASRATLAPAGGAKVHEEAAAAHRHAAAIQYDSEVRGQHEAKAAHHDEQVAAMKRRTPEDAAETLHGKALAAAKSVKGPTGKQNLPYSETAHAASVRAEQTGSKDDHAQAARLHTGAEMSHDQAREDTGYKHKGHDEAWMAHHRAAAYHRAKAQ